jgi:protein TonB
MIRTALGVSLALHAMVLAAVAPPRTQPRYVVLEARLEVLKETGGSDYLTSTAFTFPLAPGVRGPLQPQHTTPPKKEALRAVSDATLPHNAAEARDFAPGFDAARTEGPGIEVPLPDEQRYFTAKELDVLAAPFTPISFDRLSFGLDKLAERVRLRVFINEAGAVDDVRFEDRPGLPAFEDEVRREILGARYAPAVRHGRAVKSQKLMEIFRTEQK